MSHIIASSQPPPRANPFTAAIVGFRTSAILVQVERKLLFKFPAYVRDCISLMSAPAANAFSLPVIKLGTIPGAGGTHRFCFANGTSQTLGPASTWNSSKFDFRLPKNST
eukprot:Pompholyxophrys_punicea_v1_NODE_2418_length_398_cov_22.262391.p1 type:complete len:110 gc:universal NODE_2418_length_398_cov_22.262391:385-56(-)